MKFFDFVIVYVCGDWSWTLFDFGVLLINAFLASIFKLGMWKKLYFWNIGSVCLLRNINKVILILNNLEINFKKFQKLFSNGFLWIRLSNLCYEIRNFSLNFVLLICLYWLGLMCFEEKVAACGLSNLWNF